MIINKRYIRSIKKNIIFYISSSVLTAVAIFIFMTLFSAGVVTQNKISEFFDDNLVEDHQIMTILPISDDQLEKIESDYSVIMEKNVYANFDIGEKQIRMFEPTSKVNKYAVIEGNDLSSENDLLLSRDYAENNKISIGDSIELGGINFNVCGYTARPDYLYMLRELTDSYADKENFGIAIAKEIPSDSCAEYYSIRDKGDKIVELRKYINEEFTTVSYVNRNNNQRIRYAQSSPRNFIVMSVLILPVLLMLIMIIVSVVLMRMIKEERKIIGTLTALGYRKKHFKRFYSVYAVIPAAVGTVLGIAASFIFIGSVSGFVQKNFENIFTGSKISLISVGICVFLPVALYTIAAYIEISRTLKKNAVTLLQNRIDSSKKRHGFGFKNMSFNNKFRLRLVWNNKMRSVTVLLGVIISCLAMEFGFICNNSTSDFIDTSIDKIGDFNYEYYMKELWDEGSFDGDDFLMYKSFQESENNKKFSMIGCRDNSSMLKLKDLDGNTVDIGDGYYITEIAASLYGIEKGSKFSFYDAASLESFDVVIDGIIDDPVQAILYTSEKNAGNIMEIEEGKYNLILSDEKLDISDDETAVSVSKESLKDQLNTVLEATKKMIIMMIALGIVICVLVIFMMVNMVIEENKNNISMLKVLGYRNREINRLVLNVNHILVLFGMILSVPLSLLICDVYFGMMIENFACHIPSVLKISGIIICFGVLIVSYFVALCLLRKKVGRIKMTNSLKEER